MEDATGAADNGHTGANKRGTTRRLTRAKISIFSPSPPGLRLPSGYWRADRGVSHPHLSEGP